jgi:hypothetical protein
VSRAFDVATWEVNNGLNDAELACGMSNAYYIVAKLNRDIETPSKAFELLGDEEGSSCMIPGCLYFAIDTFFLAWTLSNASIIIDVNDSASIFSGTRMPLLGAAPLWHVEHHC